MNRSSARIAAASRLGAVLVAVSAFTQVALMSFPQPAQAQKGEMTGVGQGETVEMTATVQSVDYAKRTVTLVGPDGAAKTMKVGNGVRNFSQIQPGDDLVVRYSEAAVYVIAPPGTKVPDDVIAAAVARAEPGEKPAGGVAERVVITGLVTAVDPAANTISLVDPSGGMVRTLTVKNPEYQKMLPSISVGDTITAALSQALVASVTPAE